ncbi:MAG: hypothetical protein VYB54_08250 [Pseudomonadota bacterium]|nr:hypothetical protein [Pseudomonadota bacterium]
MDDTEVLLEYMQRGNQVRVAAIHAATGLEAVIVGPRSAGEAELSRVAIDKLRYLLEKQGAKPDTPVAPQRRPGRWV